jgi:hypothetical protein
MIRGETLAIRITRMCRHGRNDINELKTGTYITKVQKSRYPYAVDDLQFGLIRAIYEDGKMDGPFQRSNSRSAS